MCEFGSRSIALYGGLQDLVVRVTMCVAPAVTFRPDNLALSLATAACMGAFDGLFRLWGSCNSQALTAGPEGLEITSAFSARLVPWSNVSAIQNWHHFNGIDYVAVHHRRADRVEVATCVDYYSQDTLRSFVRACADYASSDTQPANITLAGLLERGVYLPLVWRFIQDVALATLIGFAIDRMGWAFLLGLLAASQSALIAALRHPFRTKTFVQQGGLWCAQGREARPVLAIPRALRLWTRYLDDAAHRVTSRRPCL